MPLASAAFFGFALGAGLAWATARDLMRSVQPLGARAALIVSALALLAYAPAVVLVATLAPAWSLGYVVAPERLPAWLMPCFALLVAGSVPLGFRAALSRFPTRGGAFPRRWVLVPAALGALVLAPGLPRLGAVGSYQQFHGDFGLAPLAGSLLAYALLWVSLGLVVACGCVLRALRTLCALGRDFG